MSTQRVAPAPAAPAAPAAGGSGLKYSSKIGQGIPGSWSEGKEFTAGGNYRAGDLVIVRRSDGSLKFGEIIKQEGFFGGNYEVCVTVDRAGAPDSSRVDQASDLFKPSAASLASLDGAAAPAAAAPAPAPARGGLFGSRRAAPTPPPRAAPAPPAAAPVDDAKAAAAKAAAERKAEQERIVAERKAAMEEKKRQQQEALAARKAEQERIRAEQIAKREAAAAERKAKQEAQAAERQAAIEAAAAARQRSAGAPGSQLVTPGKPAPPATPPPKAAAPGMQPACTVCALMHQHVGCGHASAALLQRPMRRAGAACAGDACRTHC